MRRAECQSESLRIRALAYLVCAVLAGGAVAGCAAGGIFGSNARGVGNDDTQSQGQDNDADGLAGGIDELGPYLEMMQRLIEGSALDRAEAFNAARDAAEYAPTTMNRLLYALALSVPGHSASDAEAAAVRLRELIAAGDTLLPAERLLATIQLNHAEQQLILAAQTAELQDLFEAAVEERSEETAATIEMLQAENQRLRTELQTTVEMLEAITSIEESISESEGP